MESSTALFIGNTIAGIHAALIVFFFFGWLIPFTSFAKRCFANIVVGGSFLVFWLIGWCPLTVWEAEFKKQAGVFARDYNVAFTARQLSLLGISPDEAMLNNASFYLIIGVLVLASFYPLYIVLQKRNMIQ